MLIGVFSGLSAAGSALICYLTGSFDGYRWIWLLPVLFVGIFVLLALIWAIVMLIMSKLVDMEKEQQEDDWFYRTYADLTFRAIIPLMRIHIRKVGTEKLPKDGRFMLVCNHLHESDPILLLWAFNKSQLAFISKRENDSRFIIGPFMHKVMCQPINRENDREALKTILRCIQLLKEDKVSIGVFPEGYCSLDYKLHPFRNGVFKIAQKAQVPIVVCTIRDTQDIFRNMRRWKPSYPEIHLLDVLTPEQLQGCSTAEIANRVYTMMAEDLGPERVYKEEQPET